MNKDLVLKITDRMRKMRLPAMAEQLFAMMELNELSNISPLDLVEKLTEIEYQSRRNNTISRYKKGAKLSQSTAHLEAVDNSFDRQLIKKFYFNYKQTTTYKNREIS